MEHASPRRHTGPDFHVRCGGSGLLLPRISLGLWQNFGEVDDPENSRTLILETLDQGITHFDLANNYGPPPGSAERTLGRILSSDLASHRDELIISTKAGYPMWEGPYGDGGSRKHLLASLDQSLRRMGLEYVDIFYSHRPDPQTPPEETMSALASAVSSGKALYIGLSNYGPAETENAAAILHSLGVPLLLRQPKYNMFHRDPESGLLDVLERLGSGCIVFSPLAQGLLTSRYLGGIPDDARAARALAPLTPSHITPEALAKVRALSSVAAARGQTMTQLALSWVLRDPRVTSALIGASRPGQIGECVQAVQNTRFEPSELESIEAILRNPLP